MWVCAPNGDFIRPWKSNVISEKLNKSMTFMDGLNFKFVTYK